MAVGLRAAGAWVAGSTSVIPGIPAGSTTGDMMVMFVGCKPFNAVIGTPAGWTNLAAGSGNNGSVAAGVDTGSVLWSVFYRAWQSGDAAPTVNITSGDTALGVIKTYSKSAAATWVTPVAEKGSDTSSGTGFSLTMGADIGITVNDMLDTYAVIAGNNATFATPTITATSATIGSVTESPATEGTTAGGTDLESSASHALVTAGTATAAAVVGWTLSVAQTGGGCLVRLREDVPAELSSASMADADRDFVTPYQDIALTFSEAVQITPAPSVGDTIAGLTVQVNGGAEQALTYRSGNATASWKARRAELIQQDDTVVLDYVQASGIILAVDDSVEITARTNLAVTNSLTKRIRETIKNAAGTSLNAVTVKYGIHTYDSGAPANANWMTREAKGTSATSAAGLLDVTGPTSAVGATVYLVVIQPDTTPTESFIWTTTVL